MDNRPWSFPGDGISSHCELYILNFPDADQILMRIAEIRISGCSSVFHCPLPFIASKGRAVGTCGLVASSGTTLCSHVLHVRSWRANTFVLRDVLIQEESARSIQRNSSSWECEPRLHMFLPILTIRRLHIDHIQELLLYPWYSAQNSWLQDGDALCFLWGTNSIYICYAQSKVLRIIVDALWYVRISLNRRDLSCPTVKEEILHYSSHYGDRLRTHPNHLAVNLLLLPDNRCLRRFLPTNLPDRF
jgi:hypothetical protein